METKKVVCHYPHCNKEAKFAFTMGLLNEEQASVELPFCQYHWYVVSGGHFKARKGEEWTFTIEGPFEQVELIEQVMGAREVTKKEKTE